MSLPSVGTPIFGCVAGGLGRGRLVEVGGSALSGKRQAQGLEQSERFDVTLGGRGDSDVDSSDLVDRVIVDLGENDLLAHTHRVVAVPVERPGVQSPKIADTRYRDRGETVQKL